jgi:hypothetical protein
VIARRSPRSLLAATATLMVVLTACGASPPPGRELADEIIDTLERDGEPLSDEVKDCMHQAVEDFRFTEDEAAGFDDLDDAAEKASEGQEQAIQIMDRFQAELADCTTAG